MGNGTEQHGNALGDYANPNTLFYSCLDRVQAAHHLILSEWELLNIKLLCVCVWVFVSLSFFGEMARRNERRQRHNAI